LASWSEEECELTEVVAVIQDVEDHAADGAEPDTAGDDQDVFALELLDGEARAKRPADRKLIAFVQVAECLRHLAQNADDEVKRAVVPRRAGQSQRDLAVAEESDFEDLTGLVVEPIAVL